MKKALSETLREGIEEAASRRGKAVYELIADDILNNDAIHKYLSLAIRCEQNQQKDKDTKNLHDDLRTFLDDVDRDLRDDSTVDKKQPGKGNNKTH